MRPDDASRVDFWRSLAPELSIETSLAPLEVNLPPAEMLLPDLRREGYVHAEGALDASAVARVRDVIVRMVAQGVPLPFVFVYDEPWALFASLRPFLSAALGEEYRGLPDFWAWHIAADDSARGWGPHRDRVRPTLDAANNPMSLTVWLPLTDATTLNGCIHVLPAHLDPRFESRIWDGPEGSSVRAPQDVRALPAGAGSLLAWNQSLLHWGGRASRLATGPRISLSSEFQRGDRTPYNPPLYDPATRPSFFVRLGLVGKQLLQYRHMYPLDDAMAALAEDLRERHVPYGEEM